jgi:hypothetical protein
MVAEHIALQLDGYKVFGEDPNYCGSRVITFRLRSGLSQLPGARSQYFPSSSKLIFMHEHDSIVQLFCLFLEMLE